MKLIRTEDAAGQVLCHDITQIIPGEFKGARFRKGHIIQPEDIPVLLSIGKENLYVWEKSPASSTRTKPPRCCTRPLRARTSTAPSRKREKSSSSPTATAC